MPVTEVVYFCDVDGFAPALDWLQRQRDVPHAAAVKLLERIERLELLGHELRRPEADFLRDGIHELRVKHLRVNYRLLYFFHTWQERANRPVNRNAAVLSHGLTKEKEVPNRDIDIAVRRMQLFKTNPRRHIYAADVGN
jgi:phage-related protein